jgi:hypothetical protein
MQLSNGADLPVSVEVLKAEAQVVAGTNYRLLLKVVDGHANTRYYQAHVWGKFQCCHNNYWNPTTCTDMQNL